MPLPLLSHENSQKQWWEEPFATSWPQSFGQVAPPSTLAFSLLICKMGKQYHLLGWWRFNEITHVKTIGTVLDTVGDQ